MFDYYLFNPIGQKGLTLFEEEYQETKDLSEAKVALIRSANIHNLDFPEKLVAIARAGAGVNNITLDECTKKGIVVFNTPGANANNVKELVLGGMIIASRNVLSSGDWVKASKDEADIAKLAEHAKKAFKGNELAGKTLGVIGLGSIGVLVANAALALGMRVLGYDPFLSVKSAWKLSHEVEHISNIEDIYIQSDYITLHLPLVDATEKMIDARVVQLFKKGVVLLNYARDTLIDEEALRPALESGHIAKYVTDFPNPTSANLPNTIITPHIGATTTESEDNCAKMAVSQLRQYVEHGNIVNSVNFPNCSIGPIGAYTRLCILHENKPNMIGRLTTWLGNRDINIVNFMNQSKDGYAYSIMDIDGNSIEHFKEDLANGDGVCRIRIIKGGAHG